jgi:formylmethanofuran dehydrogenase subunit E
MNTYQVNLMIDGVPHKAEVVARDREEAQDMAIIWAEACNFIHGEVFGIRMIEANTPEAAPAEFIGMCDVGGEQFAHYRGVAL